LHPVAAIPAHPALHRHTETLVCSELSDHELAGHGVHWLMFELLVYVPGGHPQHSVIVPRVAYPGLQTPQPVAAVPENPMWHTHAETFVWFVRLCQEFIGHGVHWLILYRSAYVPIGHGKHGAELFQYGR
jgi:hypothetical protein